MRDTPASPDADDTASDYWNTVGHSLANGPPDTLWRAHSDTTNERLLARWLPRGRYGMALKTDLFDESVGAGLYPLLSRHAGEVHGIDIADACITAAGERYPEMRARRADVRELPYANGYFDCIVSNSTLDHFENAAHIDAGLRELYRVAQPGADIFVTLDNLQNPIIWLRDLIPFRWLQRLGVLPYFVGATTTRAGLCRKLAEAGFEVRATAAVLHCPRVLAIPLSRLLQRYGSPRAQARWLGLLTAFEWLGRTPLRFFSGHFVAVHASKPRATSSVPPVD